MLYQASGSRLSSRTYFTWSLIALPPSRSRWRESTARPTGQRVGSARRWRVLTSQVARDDAFTRRRARMEELVAELRERTARIAQGGGEKAVERHRSRGKLTARERIDRLVDPGTAFLELNALAA